MREIELTTLTQAETLYRNAVSAMNEKFKGAWDDEVHDSFRLLLTQIDDNHSQIHLGVIDAGEIYSKAKRMNIDGLCQTAESLCREVEAL